VWLVGRVCTIGVCEGGGFVVVCFPPPCVVCVCVCLWSFVYICIRRMREEVHRESGKARV
jgi:hypothetical protein